MAKPQNPDHPRPSNASALPYRLSPTLTNLLSRIALAALLALAAPATAQVCQAPAPVQHPLEDGIHVPTCSPIAFSHYPPTSGEHYPVWADYKAYSLVLAPGYYIHDEEHGAVVFLINCHTPGDCVQDLARLQAVADAVPQDPLCDATVKHRIVIAGDTVMDTRFAALAWGWSLKSDCLDTAAFRAFIGAHYAQGPENTCAAGTDFSGTGNCVAPIGLRPVAPGRNRNMTHAPETLWQGTLAGRGSLSLEVVSLGGAVLARYDLGPAGPGPARAVWDAEAFRREHAASGPVACRVKVADGGGIRLLAESLAFP